ncbi:enoyl-CoA hydratase/isomerase family protein [Streptomyces sp. IBSBF 2953]|uniref:enoyl-CoA hydratase/isomerase family protein n=1 Tax=Streptomyces scabiei TaxID=1930 RepID=UPI00211A6F48|nr:enoyl-CoA hydratase/isomerase family protein [Streptomyces scabiei]MCQ9181618.1 enoyl-CoA hydratase/isomerase family protein [Streptomyces hayashii]MDX3112276.1 enoyl-CoA hydratase/isomerase family protein [Streptomyces scabiei]
MTDTAAEEILADVRRGVGRILVNRPRALNALTTDMVVALDRVLAEWEHTPLSAVVLASTGAKAFCAGGDIRTIREHSLAGDAEASERFFASEYRLNARIAEYPVPFVSLIDGLCMGGGLGLSVHGAFRVVTERAVLAMPETGIGFFPDVGSSYFLPRLPGAIGMYLGLTGSRLDAADALYTGLGTHFVPADGLDAVGDALADAPGEPVDAVLNRLAGRSPVARSGLAAVRGDLDWAFGAATLGEIEKRLRHLDTAWADSALAALEAASPQSLEITHALLMLGRQRTLRECLDAELALTRTTIRTPDFLEGVRAALVDKDRTPTWRRARLAGRPQPS